MFTFTEQGYCLYDDLLLFFPTVSYIYRHWLHGPRRTLAFSRVNFQAFPSLAIFLQTLIPVFLKIFSASSNHLFLGLPTDFFPSGIFLDTLRTVLSSEILYICLNNLNLVFLIGADPPQVCEFVCGGVY